MAATAKLLTLPMNSYLRQIAELELQLSSAEGERVGLQQDLDSALSSASERAVVVADLKRQASTLEAALEATRATTAESSQSLEQLKQQVHSLLICERLVVRNIFKYGQMCR